MICNCIVEETTRFSEPEGTPFGVHIVLYGDTLRAMLILDNLSIPYYYVRSTMTAATVTSKGQITIPSRVRTALGLEAGDRVEFVEHGKGQFAIVAATRSVRELKGLFQGKRSKPVSIEEMNAAIARRASASR
jgi:antitoxin PrlF